jgi:membrane protein
MNAQRIWGLLKETGASWANDYAPSMGAALSYYTLFSIAPLVLIVVAVAGVVFGDDAARGAMFGELRGLMGDQGAEAVESMLQAMNQPREGTFAAAAGVIVLAIGATTVFAELQYDLDRIWRAPARKHSSGLWNLIRARLLSFGMILGIAFLLMVSLVLSALISALGRLWAFEGWEALAHGIDLALSLAMTTVLFALIYRYIPRAHVDWRDVWIGAAVTALLFAVGKWLIGLYIGKSAVASYYGAAGSLIVLMIWVYYSALIFLFGAEFTWVYAHAHGSRRGQPRPGASPVPQAEPEPAPQPVYPLLAGVPETPRKHPFALFAGALAFGAALGLMRTRIAKLLGALGRSVGSAR